ncbi:hypothetical protein N6L27_04125 [Leisingera sp. SS27]|uniref:hypothetical protein n=1 Tax=Leisingera sp. SS27 TaxID=2979462 RepID=UPI00232E1CAE|nr:hypothetical protein [Leisingera sp. SS27]MDC0657178.1 hypothetical protein [Leisingera sp. SS27]
MNDIVALSFGVGIIIAFSHERFNRISYETGKRLDRLVLFLTPDKLRARRQVTYAYFIYTLSLIILYLILCAYAEVLLPLIGGQSLLPEIGASTLPTEASTSTAPVSDASSEPTTGFAPMGTSAAEFWIKSLEPATSSKPMDSSSGINIAPEVSMGLALIMVGLAPSIKALVRVDEWLRMFAHRVAGIPTWVIDTSDALRSNAKVLRFFTDGEEDNSSEYLISEPERKRVMDLHVKAKPFLGNLDDFILNVEVVLVASAWFLDEKLRTTGAGDKNRFEEIENELRRRKNELFSAANSPDLSHEGWDAVATAADELASDFCVLIALYDEQDIIQPYDQRPAPNRKPTPRAGQAAAIRRRPLQEQDRTTNAASRQQSDAVLDADNRAELDGRLGRAVAGAGGIQPDMGLAQQRYLSEDQAVFGQRIQHLLHCHNRCDHHSLGPNDFGR